MEFIKSIKIWKFRSIKSLAHGLTPSHLNIFVGQNDQGKSNFLRALNLFFNDETDIGNKFRFEDDYCYHSNTGRGTRLEVKIELEIHPPADRFKNPDPIRWVKIWKKDGSKIDERTLIANGKPLSQRNNVYKWLDKIRYRYVPAIKGQDYFSSLMGELHDVLNESHAEILGSQGEKFISGIQSVTRSITKELKNQLGISNAIQVPSDFKQLFSTLDFGVKEGENTYRLKQRGDGIKVRHIPIILKYMSEREKSISIPGYVKPDTIWGFEEPENNLELKYAFELAEKFKSYAKDIQIFITTHSPAFYSLSEDNQKTTSTFYVEQQIEQCTDIKIINIEEIDYLHERMGLLPIITPYLTQIYNKEKEIDKLNEHIFEIKSNKKFIVLTEDSNFETLQKYLFLHGCKKSETHFESYHGSGNINHAIYLGRYLKSNNPDSQIIIHRDRDYHENESIEEIRKKIESENMHFFVTKGVDIESQFISSRHINYLYETITVADAKIIIEQATDRCEQLSIDRLIDQNFKDNNKAEENAYAKKIRKIQEKYQLDKKRYRYGKKVLGAITAEIQKTIKKNPNLLDYSPYVIDTNLEQIFTDEQGTDEISFL